MKMLKRWISVCLVILLLAGVAFDHSSLIGSTVEAAGLEETDGAEPAETPDASEETSDVPSLLSEGDGADTPTPEEQTVTNTETETEAPAEKTETKQEESTEPEKQTVTNTDTETKAPAKKTETKQEESTEPAKQTVTNTDNETKEPVTKTSDDVSKESAQPSAYKDKYEDDTVTISVSAEAGIVPEGAELSVTPIEKTEITDDMSEEDKAKAEEINAQYDLTEKKLNEDSEENEETMEGFLAYDISFLVNGEEIEPSGDVKVVMDFKEAAIPEGVSEDAAVAVKHLKEDENAEDGVVVEDMAEKADVQTTDKAEVEKVELTSDNFSTYAVAWAARRPRAYQFTTVDTDSTGLNINLFDYGSQINSKTNGTSYRFVGRWGVGVNDDSSENDKDESFCQGLVNRNLGTDGIPIASSNNESLAYLFSTTSGNDVNVKETYSNLTGLFQRNGQWYSYDSSTNHAQLTGNELVVYNQALVPQYGYNNSSDFMVGNFLPFNDITESSYDHYNTVKGVDIFNVHEAKEDTALWFGMTIDGTFYQPSNGKVNGENMVFEFAGDDDVWVFIDNVLVLDIGGIHGKVSGSINFATGDVFVDGVDPTTLKELYRDAFKEANPNASPGEVNSYVNNIIDSETHTFKDYTLHKMNFFYLERGGGASNCKLDFNLPTLPEGSITVQKEIDNFMEGAYSDVGFQFELYADLNKDGTCEKITSANGEYAEYQIMDADSTVGGTSTSLGKNGIFTLKHNQKAVFSGFPVDTKYYVKEVGITYDEYDAVEITAGNVTDKSGISNLTSETQPGEGYVQSSEVTVGETPYMVFHNHCNMTELKTLYVQKVLKNSQDEENSDYQMLVTIDGKPYIGKYTTGPSIENQGSDVKDAQNGHITLKAGETARLIGYVNEDNKSGFPAGTAFEVTEARLDSEIYEDPQYNVTGADNSSTQGKASGKLSTGSNAVVTVTNTLKARPDKPFIEVQKTFIGIDSPETELPNFKIMVYADKEQETLVEKLTLQSSSYDEKTTNEDGSITYVWRIYNLEGGTYWIKEEGKELRAFNVTTTINGESVEGNGVVDVTTVAPTFGFSRYAESPQCNATEFDFQANIVAARLTQDSHFVWSEEPLSVKEREAIVNALKDKDNENWGDMSVSNTSFYSGQDVAQKGYSAGKGTIYIKSQDGVKTLVTYDKNVWTHCIAGIYERTSGQNAEIEITNTYSVNIDLQKYGTYYTKQREGAKFSLFKGTLNTEGATPIIDWGQDPVSEEYTNFKVSSTNLSELELKPGYYKLVETEAPLGFQLLNQDICFKVDKGTVTLVNATTGDAMDSKQDMWELTTEGTITIKIKNNVLYELPSAGGSGIYWYTIGGMLLMMAGSLILYKNKRREVLER